MNYDELTMNLRRCASHLDSVGDYAGIEQALGEAANAIETLAARVAELEREQGGFHHLADFRQCMIETACENEALRNRIEELELSQTPRPIEDAPRRLDQSEVTEEGFYWRYPGIPVRVFKRKRGSRKGELWFDGFGMVGMVNNPGNKGIWFVGPITPPAPTEVTK